jgi:hydroxymethylpyrimidine/phosphomethylpyrimidine kinase
MDIAAMTIAGSDSGGGAGVQADVKTFQALGIHGTCAVTAITSQNTTGVIAIFDVPLSVIACQIHAILADFDVRYVKTGMLSRVETVRLVAEEVERHKLKVVVDPVMAAEAGGRLLNPDAVDALKYCLLPVAEVTTPNVYEAGVLSGVEIKDMDSAKKACKKIHALGVKNVMLTGGHFGGTDILYDGEKFTLFEGPLVKGGTHGTGCTYAAAMTAYLAKGETIEIACARAKLFVKEAVLNSMDVGHGVHPVNPGGCR